MSKEEVIETQTSRMWLVKEGVLWVEMKQGTHDTIDTAKENVDAASRIASDRMVPVLVDMRKVRSVSREARIHYAKEAPRLYCSAQALLVDSPVTRVIANFAIGLSKQEIPIRLFSSERNAMEWLNGFVSSNER